MAGHGHEGGHGHESHESGHMGKHSAWMSGALDKAKLVTAIGLTAAIVLPYALPAIVSVLPQYMLAGIAGGIGWLLGRWGLKGGKKGSHGHASAGGHGHH